MAKSNEYFSGKCHLLLVHIILHWDSSIHPGTMITAFSQNRPFWGNICNESSVMNHRQVLHSSPNAPTLGLLHTSWHSQIHLVSPFIPANMWSLNSTCWQPGSQNTNRKRSQDGVSQSLPDSGWHCGTSGTYCHLSSLSCPLQWPNVTTHSQVKATVSVLHTKLQTSGLSQYQKPNNLTQFDFFDFI